MRGIRQLTIAERRSIRLVLPTTPAQLLAYIRGVLQFQMPAGRGREGGGPFGYILHSFFEPTAESADAHNPPDSVIWACRGGGKTTLGAVATLLDMLFKPGIQIRILGGSFEQSARMYATLIRLLTNPVFRDLLASDPTQRNVELVNTSRVEVLSQSERSVRGTRVHKLRCDEVELFEAEIWEAAQLTTRSGWCGRMYVRGSVEALSTMHKVGGLMSRLVEEARAGKRRLFSWGVMDVLERCGSSRHCDSCKLFPSCKGHLKSIRSCGGGFMRIDDALAQLDRVGDPTWRAEMLCEQPSTTDCVYPEFDEAVHVFDGAWPAHTSPSGASGGVGGVDFGFRAPTVFLWGVVDAASDLWIARECVLRNHITTDIIEQVDRLGLDLGRPHWVGADPAGGARSEQTGESVLNLWKRAGYVMRTRILGIPPGIAAVRARLKRADGRIRLRIHRSCTHLIEAMKSYRYEPARPNRDLDAARPIKDGHDHAADALRYLITNLDRPSELTKRDGIEIIANSRGWQPAGMRTAGDGHWV